MDRAGDGPGPKQGHLGGRSATVGAGLTARGPCPAAGPWSRQPAFGTFSCDKQTGLSPGRRGPHLNAARRDVLQTVMCCAHRGLLCGAGLEPRSHGFVSFAVPPAWVHSRGVSLGPGEAAQGKTSLSPHLPDLGDRGQIFPDSTESLEPVIPEGPGVRNSPARATQATATNTQPSLGASTSPNPPPLQARGPS